ncbi:MAG: hypothetical protein A2268_12945 [Candidatus Raymondbacteria bacterium RifOxyA12_full_50_37]|uniref:Uncharacterized protein n=1 Tax=Candidatus Raymondbacteria bacterium RIFOXYD12_FULL_49_13 TaxID=1817890 RepID=A0A1F7EZT4_UNCRA|nr:MAG: hypothetical protein A2268_12945 [Candidatus Raymondbacteria bacterium RifOxyA12_full_50_37]OGJ92973.1 MAG: hypothetical protein A2248_18080 [Candidatus Raymondbacteria bacterium RIFOXYA2_FULL_49_16]OGJ97655.1 MAG: hypothetical protein A2487_13070 [Candidatus Raymondbacteria bacterium RifOxyC12_full_50_8]OGJ99887.1 MAG: hypothetical protein A2519_00060 [Candidatus Raymondbacteria bacterium RIFOXYD12_FULL_49_13]OGP40769.1 MAG: hypothetical protein A2324_03650 [Candidatus Raymondbacteria 
MRLLFIAFMFFPFAVHPGTVKEYVSEIEQHQLELNEIKQRLQKNRSEVKKLSSREANLVTKLKRIDENITLVNNYIKKLTETEKAVSLDIDSIKADLKTTSTSLADKKEMLRQRVRNIYIKGRYDHLDIVLGSNSFTGFLKRNSFFKRIADNDRALIDRIFDQKRRIEDKKRQLERRFNEVHALKEEKGKEQQLFSSQKKKRTTLLKEVTGKKQTYIELARELEEKQREMNSIIEVLEAARKKALADEARARRQPKGKDLAGLQGRLPWPVEGKIIKKFGTNVHPVYKTKTINNGIDIKASEGEQVTTVAEGEVMYIGQIGGFGNFLIVGHGGGYYSLYANLASIAVKKGDTVTMGGTIGIAGDTGSFEGTKLHFELRKERQVLDPTKWLSKK